MLDQLSVLFQVVLTALAKGAEEYAGNKYFKDVNTAFSLTKSRLVLFDREYTE